MDPALKTFLEAMEKSLKDFIRGETSASIERHDELVRKLEAQATPASSTELTHDKDAVEHGIYDDSIPSPTADPVTVSARTAARHAPVINNFALAPATCSTERLGRDATESMPASTLAASLASPPVTITSVLADAAASDGTLDGEPIKGPASTTERSLVVSGAVPNDTMAVVHLFCSPDCVTQVITEPSPTFSTTTPPQLWASWSSSVLTATAASDGTFDDKSIKGAASRVTTSSSGSPHSGICALGSAFIPSALPCLSSSWHQEHRQYHARWPPPYLYLSGCDISKSRPAPWPSFADLPGGMQLTEPRPPHQGTYGEFSVVVDVMYHVPGTLSCIRTLHIGLRCELDREERFISVQQTIDREEQFTSLGMSLNISEKFLKTPYAESPTLTVSGLIKKVASVFQLWRTPWFSFLYLTSATRYGLTLFEWEIAWQLDAKCFGYFQWHVARALSISVTSTDRQCILVGCPSLFYPHECSLRVQYRQGDILEGCLSTCYAPILLQYWTYGHLNSCAWYPALPCTIASHEDYASANLTSEKNEVLIAFLVQDIHCYNTTALQSPNGTMESDLLYYYLASTKLTMNSLICRGTSACVFKLWHIPWFSFLFLGLTSAERYGLALLQWEIAWQLYVERFDVSIGWQLQGTAKSASHNLTIEVAMGMKVLDMQQLRGFSILVVSVYNTLVAEPVFTEFQPPDLLYHHQASKISPVPLFELQGPTYKLFSEGPINPFSQWLQSLVQLIYRVQDLGLESVCKLSGNITKSGILFSSLPQTKPPDGTTGLLLDQCNRLRFVLVGVSIAAAKLVSWVTGHIKQFLVALSTSAEIVCVYPMLHSSFSWCGEAQLSFYEHDADSCIREPIQAASEENNGCTRSQAMSGMTSSTRYNQAPFQEGRDVIIVMAILVQDFVNLEYHLGFDCESADNCDALDFSPDWISIHRNYYFYLAEVSSNFYYHIDFDNVQELRVQWDPGGRWLSVESAWGQAEFQEGKDVRSLLYMGRDPSTCTWAGPGCASSRAEDGYKYQHWRQRRGIPLDHDKARLRENRGCSSCSSSSSSVDLNLNLYPYNSCIESVNLDNP